MGCNDVTIPLVKLSQILIFINLLVILVILILSADIYWVSDIKNALSTKCVLFLEAISNLVCHKHLGEECDEHLHQILLICDLHLLDLYRAHPSRI